VKNTDQSSYRRCIAFIAGNTRALRLARGLTQQTLATEAEVDLRFVQRIERGTTNLSVKVLISISSALGVEPTAMFAPAKIAPARAGRPRKEGAPVKRSTKKTR
jgi:transcriptional regulator with XRE-family HTH domain